MNPHKHEIVIGGVAWVSGIVAYFALLAWSYGERGSIFDFAGVVQLSLYAFAPSYLFVYLPIMHSAERVAHKIHHWWLFPLCTIALSIVPISLIWLGVGIPAALMGNGITRSLPFSYFTSPETLLFYGLFGVSGLILGIIFPFSSRAR